MDSWSIQRKEIERVYGKISPFELKDKLINLAEESKKSGTHSLLDAGRGNPNWIAATPREAFFTFGQFAVSESRHVWNDNDLAGMPQREGIAGRFIDYIKKNQNAPGIELLRKMINYGVTIKGFNPDNWIYELTDGIIGDNYPHPDRMLPHVEAVVNDFLIQELCYNEPLEGKFKTFAVEGATAAMCYVFDSLIANNILSKGDKIAIMTPIFTPYLEVPRLPRYDFEIVNINADELDTFGNHTWQYSKEQLEKLKDSSIKALFIVNPSNPPSVAMNIETVNTIKDIINDYNSDLMIISDDVYSTFVDGFRSLMADLPYNTLGVYSFSKYFGVTGWRLGTISLYDDNVFDKILRNQDDDKKARARRRYAGISSDPDSISFSDRMVADSRQVALNHTAGLSTPQQVQMAFFSLFAITDKENRYKKLTKSICRHRQRLLFEGLGLELTVNPLSAAYYTQFDLLEWAAHNYSNDFAEYLSNNHKPVEILIRLAEESSIVLLSGNGFSGPEWSVRISLANLNEECYSKIGSVLKMVLEEYADNWKRNK